MNAYNPIDLLFGGLEKQGPGGDVHTLNVLRLLPRERLRVVVDAGCGTGRQTLVLAKELGTLVHAVDSHEPFLRELTRRAEAAGVGRLVQTHCMDMKDIPAVFRHVDLLWSEGAAYSIGFPNALNVWASAINEGGFAAVSELSWLSGQVPDAVREFWSAEYPGMQSVYENVAAAEEAGYRVLSTYTLPADAWVEGYYDHLEPRAKSLIAHPDSAVRNLAAGSLREIEIFNSSEGSYGYVFYVLTRLSQS